MTEPGESKTTFLWYDYESFGADVKKDRPAQFGAVRTDENLNIIGRPMLFYSQLSDDYLPAPAACLVTGITPVTLMEEETALPEAEFAKKIYEEMSAPGTVSVGYNSQRFDDVMSRFLFWRNLMPAYDTERGEGRGRLDIYSLVRALFAFYPETIRWKQKEEGTYSLRLEDLTAANGISHGHAHDAGSDAHATLSLARLIRSKQPKLWDFVLNQSAQNHIAERMLARKPLLYVNPYGSQQTRFLSVIYPLFEDPDHKGTWVCWDLTSEPKELWDINEEDMKARRFVTREARALGVKPLPFVNVDTRKNPVVTLGINYLEGAGKGLFKESREELIARARALKDEEENFSKLLGLFAASAEDRAQKAQAQLVLPEESLYCGGFLSQEDKTRLARFRMLPPDQMGEAFSRMEFDREDLGSLVLHYMARNYPEYTLDADSEKIWYEHKEKKLFEGIGGAKTFKEFFTEIQAARNPEDERNMQILDELQEWGESLLSDYQR